MVRDESMDGILNQNFICFSVRFSCDVGVCVSVGGGCGTRWHSVKREVWKINPLMKLGQELKKHKSQGQI